MKSEEKSPSCASDFDRGLDREQPDAKSERYNAAIASSFALAGAFIPS